LHELSSSLNVNPVLLLVPIRSLFKNISALQNKYCLGPSENVIEFYFNFRGSRGN